ncbi:4602_t:CDS:2, partial [Dentiscutata heterogama]
MLISQYASVKDEKSDLCLESSSLNKDKILCLKGEIDKLKAKVEELELEIELEYTSHDSDTTSFRDKISELNSLNHILEQEKDDLNSKKHELKAKIGRKDSEITSLEAKTRIRKLKDQLEQQIFQSSHESNIIGRAEADPNSAKNSLEKEFLPQETNTHLAEQILKASSEFNEVIGDDSKPEKVNEITSPEIIS